VLQPAAPLLATAQALPEQELLQEQLQLLGELLRLVLQQMALLQLEMQQVLVQVLIQAMPTEPERRV
jgi:hypothetical protein